MFPHQLEARDIALKAVHGLGSLEVHRGNLLPEVFDFYAKIFQPSKFCMFPFECKCVLLQFFFYGGICSEERMHF